MNNSSADKQYAGNPPTIKPSVKPAIKPQKITIIVGEKRLKNYWLDSVKIVIDPAKHRVTATVKWRGKTLICLFNDRGKMISVSREDGTPVSHAKRLNVIASLVHRELSERREAELLRARSLTLATEPCN